MTRRLRVVVALAVAAVLAGCSSVSIYDVPVPGNAVGDENSFEVKAEFADALNVVPRTAVMVDDVRVGQVESVTRSGWNAKVTLRVRDDVVLPDDARAQIQQTSLLGEKYIALSAPTGQGSGSGRLGEGDTIGLDRTGLNPEVEEVLGALSLLLNGGGIGQLQSITSELNQMMSGRTDDIRGVLREVNTLVGTLDTQREDIIGALDSVNDLSATLVAERGVIDDALASVGPAVDVLRDQHEELVGMLVELDKLGVVGTRVVNSTKDDLIAELRHLEPLLRRVADVDDQLVPAIGSLLRYPFPDNAEDSVKGDFANVIFRLNINLTPVSEGGLIPTSIDELGQVCRSLPTAPLCGLLTNEQDTGALDALGDLCGSMATLDLCSLLPIGAQQESAQGDGSAPSGEAAPQDQGQGQSTVLPPPSGSPSGPSSGGETVDGLTGLVQGLLGGGGR